ncbi:hypothetical protein DCAR_0104448 [Daucus carota subsp. sativus]|uniref:Uncharacterized protein n=1 Tax=Daucus carota subsp. sativus TaxID=79200 RepID=A0A166IUP5_DAUCS|nr:PREDICTED: uncharacterized protein LOC108224132 [Daucus carota subsp. sativus]WOG85260.1 hypothetical protein DCAR_0104448 [Daucus carota subsp. sativus]
MAYYNSNYWDGYTGEYQDSSYNSHDVVPFHFSQSYSDFEPQTNYYNDSITYDASNQVEYSGFYDPCLVNCSGMNYSMHSFTEPAVVEYDPPTYQTQYFISYKTVTFNESNNEVYDPTPYDGIYDEYDPTPYDGGYDQTVTYGKPLPPSDQICYPRSSTSPAGLSLEGFSYNSIPSPYGDHDSGSSSTTKALEDGKSADGGGGKESNAENEGTLVTSTNFDEEKESNGELEIALVENYDTGNGRDIEGFNSGHDYPWIYYDYGYGDGRIEGYEKYGYDKQVVAQTQHGYGSDGVMNYCESILGYWPCLAKKNKKTNELAQENGNTKGGSNLPKETDLCKTAAEYIFGSSVGCGEASDRDGIESYYRQQPCYGQEMYYEKCDENSWIQKFNIF